MITSQITASACQLGCPHTLLPPYKVALHRGAPGTAVVSKGLWMSESFQSN